MKQTIDYPAFRPRPLTVRRAIPRTVFPLLLAASAPLGCNKETLILGDDNPDAGIAVGVSGSGGVGGSGGGGDTGGTGGDVGGSGGDAGSGQGGGGGAPPLPVITDPFGTTAVSCTGIDETQCNGGDCCTSLNLPAGVFALGRTHASLPCEEQPTAGAACDTDGETCFDVDADRVWGCVPSETEEARWADLGAVDGDVKVDYRDCVGIECFAHDAGPLDYGENEPEIVARVSAFALDKYEVTVGRFRRFVSVYDSIEVQPGVGAHPNIPGSGWQEAWNENRYDRAAVLTDRLKCDVDYQTWTDEWGSNESLPINCVDWYHAFLFCAWDGGRLPTEAEWEYAASGGEENRPYPWGNEEPASDVAVFAWRGNGSQDETFADILRVGSRPLGDGRWGHSDLAGSMREWTMDGYTRSYEHLEPGCVDCFGGNDTSHVVRGSGFDEAMVRSNVRRASGSGRHLGFRCARDVVPSPTTPM